MTTRAVVIGVGHYLPDRIVPNSEFEKTLETSDEWIRSRSGIERRHFAAEGQTTPLREGRDEQIASYIQVGARQGSALDSAAASHLDRLL